MCRHATVLPQAQLCWVGLTLWVATMLLTLLYLTVH